MNRRVMCVSVAIAVAVGLFFWNQQTHGETKRPVTPAVVGAQSPPLVPSSTKADAPGVAKPVKQLGSEMPVQQVILFSSGVGYFRRGGEIDGNTRVDLAFPSGEVNDVIKSLVLQDQGKGHSSAVSLDSHDPVEKTLRSFALDLTGNPSYGQLLNQARGEKVEVIMLASPSQPGTMTGTIIGMESKVRPAGGTAVMEVDMLNLLCADGMRCIPLDQVQRVRFLNPGLESEFKRALDVLSLARDTQKKIVSLSFNGEGKRTVRAGYVVEAPMWKSSYRLVLDKNGKPSLQGWALVENTTDNDWSNVKLSLVSGRPISFQMNLHPPLYVPRPTVEPDLFASLRPPTFNPAMMNANNFQPPGGFNLGNGAQFQGGPACFGQGGFNFGQGGFNFQQGGFNFNQGGFQFGMGTSNTLMPGNRYQPGYANNTFNPQQQPVANDPMGNPVSSRLSYEELEKRRNDNKDRAKDEAKQLAEWMLDPRNIAAAAAGEEVGDYFKYTIDQPVSLPRQKSALIPILNKELEGTKVSVFNENMHGKFPLLGLRFKNTSGQHLVQGPVTIYEDDSYSGDARILDMQPGEERYIGYALDLGTEVKTTSKTTASDRVAVRFAKDNLNAIYKLKQTRTYYIKNRSEHDRVVVIEHPMRAGWRLISPEKPLESTRDLHRFEVVVKAGKLGQFDVVEERAREDQVALSVPEEQAPRYVLELGAEILPASKTVPDKLIGAKVVKGVVDISYRTDEPRTYHIANRSDTDRTFDVEHRIRKGWSLGGGEQLKDPKSPLHKFEVKVAAGKDATREVTEERTHFTTASIHLLSEELAQTLLDSPAVSNDVKTAIRKVQGILARLTETTKQISEFERQLKALGEDQNRLRLNFKEVPSTAAAYKRYLEKFDKQEVQIEEIQSSLEKLRKNEQEQSKELLDYRKDLNLQ